MPRCTDYVVFWGSTPLGVLPDIPHGKALVVRQKVATQELLDTLALAWPQDSSLITWVSRSQVRKQDWRILDRRGLQGG